MRCCSAAATAVSWHEPVTFAGVSTRQLQTIKACWAVHAGVGQLQRASSAWVLESAGTGEPTLQRCRWLLHLWLECDAPLPPCAKPQQLWNIALVFAHAATGGSEPWAVLLHCKWGPLTRLYGAWGLHWSFAIASERFRGDGLQLGCVPALANGVAASTAATHRAAAPCQHPDSHPHKSTPPLMAWGSLRLAVLLVCSLIVGCHGQTWTAIADAASQARSRAWRDACPERTPTRRLPARICDASWRSLWACGTCRADGPAGPRQQRRGRAAHLHGRRCAVDVITS